MGIRLREIMILAIFLILQVTNAKKQPFIKPLSKDNVHEVDAVLDENRSKSRLFEQTNGKLTFVLKSNLNGKEEAVEEVQLLNENEETDSLAIQGRRALSRRCPSGFSGPWGGMCFYYHPRRVNWSSRQITTFCRRDKGADNPFWRGRGYFGCKKKLTTRNTERRTVCGRGCGRRNLSSRRCPRMFHGPYSGVCYYFAWAPMKNQSTHQKRQFCWKIGGHDVITLRSGWGCKYVPSWVRDPNERVILGRRTLETTNENEVTDESEALFEEATAEEIEGDDRRVLHRRRCRYGYRYYRGWCIPVRREPVPSWRRDPNEQVILGRRTLEITDENADLFKEATAEEIEGSDRRGLYYPYTWCRWGYYYNWFYGRCTPYYRERSTARYGRRVLETDTDNTDLSEDFITEETEGIDRRGLSSQRCPRGFSGPQYGNKCIYHVRRPVNWSNRQKTRFCQRIGGHNYIHPSSYRGRYWGCYKTLYPARDPNERRRYGRRSLETETENTDLSEDLITEETEGIDRRGLSSQRCPRGFRGPQYGNKCIYHVRRPVNWSNRQRTRFCQRIGGDNYIHPSSYRGRYWGCYKTLYPARDPNERRRYGRRRGLQNLEETFEDIFEEIENSEDLEDMENFEEIFEDVEDIENIEEIMEEIENFKDIEDIENLEDLLEEIENSEDIPEYIYQEIDDDFEEIEAEFEEMLESFSGECLDGWNEVDGECFILGETPLSLDEADLHCQELNELAKVVDFMALDEFEEDEKVDFLCSYSLEDSEAIIDDLVPFTNDETDCKVETPFNGVYRRSDETTESGAPVFVGEDFGYQAFVKDGLWVFENPDDEYLASMISLTISESETQPKTNGNWLLIMSGSSYENEIEGLPIDGCDPYEDCMTFTVGGCGSIENEEA